MGAHNDLKLPWVVGRESDYEGVSFIAINERGDEDGGDDLIWVLDTSPYGGPYGIKPVDRQRAKLVVLAVNHHDALMTALEDIAKAAKFACALCDDEDRAPWEMVEQRARAALAAVRGQK